jgi:hypothetical protein
MSLNVNIIAKAMKNRKAIRIIKVRIKAMSVIASIAKAKGFSNEWLKSVFVKANFVLEKEIPQIAHKDHERKTIYEDQAIRIIKVQRYYFVYYKDKDEITHYIGYFVKH